MGLNSVLLVAAGGALGAVGRHAVGAALKTLSGFPWGTLGVNLLGSLLMGLLIGWLAKQPHETLRLFLAVGVLGGFTTFSAFSMDLFLLLEKRDMAALGLYLGGSVAGGLILFSLGYLAVRGG